jgi:FkbM family methyltransferase
VPDTGSDLGVTWYSEVGQDEWVHSLHQTPGFFVDVGAFDGVEYSNSYALEHLGWSGLCVEPESDAFGRCQAARSCEVVCAAASDYDGRIPFDGAVVGRGHYVAEARTLNGMLEEVNAPQVDYLSIDVEGHELAVLAGIDLQRWNVQLLTVEHNLYRDGPAHKDAIHAYLTERGYERVREDVLCVYGPYEDWWQRA